MSIGQNLQGPTREHQPHAFADTDCASLCIEWAPSGGSHHRLPAFEVPLWTLTENLLVSACSLNGYSPRACLEKSKFLRRNFDRSEETPRGRRQQLKSAGLRATQQGTPPFDDWFDCFVMSFFSLLVLTLVPVLPSGYKFSRPMAGTGDWGQVVG